MQNHNHNNRRSRTRKARVKGPESPLTPSTLRSLREELKSEELLSWAVSSAEILGQYIIPGAGFFCTRDLIVYPRGYFLDCGILALCGTALYSRTTRPFVDMCLFPGGSLDPESLPFLEEEMGFGWHPNKKRRTQAIVRMRDQVLWHFDLPEGRSSRTGSKDLQKCVRKGRLAPLPS